MCRSSDEEFIAAAFDPTMRVFLLCVSMAVSSCFQVRGQASLARAQKVMASTPITCAEKEVDEVLPTGIFADMITRGPGQGMLFHFNDLMEIYQEVAEVEMTPEGVIKWQDPYVSASQMSTLNARLGAGAPSAEETMAMIEREQGIKRRDEAGAALVYFEQWTKCLNDYVRLQKTGSSQPGGGGFFKW